MVKKVTASASPSASTPAGGSPAKSASPVKEYDGAALGGLRSGLGDEAVAAGLGASSRGASASATPAPGASDEPKVMRAPQPVPGSGDGGDAGAECFQWADLPMNKQGYRYYPCALSPNVSPSPAQPFYRTVPGPTTCAPVHLSWLDRSNFLRISPDAATATTDRGYRSGRANVAVREGTWYYEVIVERGDGPSGAGRGTGEHGNAHVRVGWARREANLDAPVGADAYSYGVRDVGGEKLHISRPKPYGRPFRTGDVVGCLISLPPRPPVTSEDEPAFVKRWRIPLRYKGANYFEMDEYPAAKEMEALVDRQGKPAAPPAAADDTEPAKKKVKKQGGDKPSGGAGSSAGAGAKGSAKRPPPRDLPTLEGSYVSFFLNGEPLADAPAFEDLYDFLPLPPNEEEHRYVGPRRGPASLERERESYQYHDDGSLGYFPMVSCFGRGKLRVNFGPEWERPPVGGALPQGTRPVCERWEEFRAEELVYDERDEARLAERYRREMAAAAQAEARRRAKAAASGAGTPASNDATPRRSAPASKKRKKATPAPGDAADAGTPASTTPRATPGPTPAPSSPAPSRDALDADGDVLMAHERRKADTPSVRWDTPVKAGSPEVKPEVAEPAPEPLTIHVKHEPGGV